LFAITHCNESPSSYRTNNCPLIVSHHRLPEVGAGDTGGAGEIAAFDATALAAAIAADTKEVVATLMELSLTGGTDEVGVPVNAGLLRGAPPKLNRAA
jgi:hypothetical protein